MSRVRGLLVEDPSGQLTLTPLDVLARRVTKTRLGEALHGSAGQGMVSGCGRIPTAEDMVSNTIQCGFESHRPHVVSNIRKTVDYVPKLARHIVATVRNAPVEWVDVNTGAVESEAWSRRSYWRTFRPRYDAFLNRLDCGCSRRFGHIVYYRMGCPENHGGMLDLQRDVDAT